eukprot:Sdes_comp19982_c0_seq1m12577
MAKQKKKRTHLKGKTALAPSKTVPRSFVVPRGHVGPSLATLVSNFRMVMEPNTASRLRIQKKNVLKDFVAMAGPLGVSHFHIFNHTKVCSNLKICRLPKGPTLSFQLVSYTLMRDIIALQKHPKAPGTEYKTAPLIVLSNFSNEVAEQKLTATVLQNMFPAINIQSVKLADVRRCVLFHYNSETGLIDFRHFSLNAAPTGLSKAVKRIVQTKIPSMHNLEDISDYIFGGGNGGYTSESDMEDVGGENEVTLSQNLTGRGNTKEQQRAIKLIELGPRMSLKLMKIEEGFCEGNVLYHNYFTKSEEEVRKTEMILKRRQKEKETRRKQQEENVRRKLLEKENHRIRCGGKPSQPQESDEDVEGPETKTAPHRDHVLEEDISDSEWYRREVGEEPEPGSLNPAKKFVKRGSFKGAAGRPSSGFVKRFDAAKGVTGKVMRRRK